ncbi:MAG: protein kinase [Verrucomicrobiales bacterium]|nr:protein kinase [Verrucomicrobiales bacterium]
MSVGEPASGCAGCGCDLGRSGGIEGFCASCLAEATWGGTGVGLAGEVGEPSGRVGKYELLEELGRGGMGIVYRARQAGLEREVALKVLRLGPWASAADRERFRREAVALAALRHPLVVTVFDVGEDEGHAFLAMELVAGRSLAELSDGAPLEPTRAARYLLGVAEAVGAAHEVGILHRDLKPANVLIDMEDQPRVTDFGLAKLLDGEGRAGDSVTRTGEVLGSPGYLPPEQADPSRGAAGFGADVYSLGALLYHLLTGRPPFAGVTLTATLAQVLHNDPVPPRRLHPVVPLDLETICLKCLQKNPRRRYVDAGAVAADLRAFLEHRPIEARAVSGMDRTWLWCRRRPALACLIVALFLALGLGTWAVWWQARENRRNLYAADLRLASLALEDGDLGRARELLQAHKPGRGEGDFTWRWLSHRSAGDQRRELGVHPWIVGSMAWSTDGRWLASGSVGSETVGEDLRLWEVGSTGGLVSARVLASQGARQVAWFPDRRRLLAVHFDRRVRIWDVERSVVVSEVPGRSAGLSRDGRRWVVCEGDPYSWSENPSLGEVRVYGDEGDPLCTMGESRLVAISPDGEHVAGTEFGEWIWVRRVGAPAGQERRWPSEGPVWAFTFTVDGKRLVGTGFDSDVRVWDLDMPGGTPRRLVGHRAATWGAAVSPDGRWLATGASDQTIRLWDLGTFASAGRLRGHGGEVWCVAFRPDGRWLASGGKDRGVLLWTTALPVEEGSLEARPYSPAAFSSEGKWLLTTATGETNGAWCHDLSEAEGGMSRFVPVPDSIGFAASPDHVLAASGFELAEVERTGWRTGWRTLEHVPGEPSPSVWATEGSGRWMAGGADGGRISVWEVATGRRVRHERRGGATPWRITLSRDGSSMAVTLGEPGFLLGTVLEGDLTPLRAHADMGKDAAFSWDGQLLATASVDGTIKLWDVPSRRLRETLRGHRSEVTSVAFAPDGVTLASGEYGHGLRLWHLPTRREVAAIALPDTDEWLAFSPAGDALAVRVHGGRMRVLRAPSWEAGVPHR